VLFHLLCFFFVLFLIALEHGQHLWCFTFSDSLTFRAKASLAILRMAKAHWSRLSRVCRYNLVSLLAA
jgi:hypothetical protein